MPIRRSKYAQRKALIRRRRKYGRVMRSMLTRPPRRPQIYNFKRQYFLENNIVVPNGGSGIVQTFTLNGLPGFTDFTNLYDQYMIKKVVVKIIPKISENALAVGTFTIGNADLCQVHSAIDYDDSTAPPGINTLVEYQSYKMTRGNQIHTRVLVPKVELGVAGVAGTVTGAGPKSYQWLDCDDVAIPHRGIKFWFSGPVTATSLYFDTLVKVYLSCKNVL